MSAKPTLKTRVFMPLCISNYSTALNGKQYYNHNQLNPIYNWSLCCNTHWLKNPRWWSIRKFNPKWSIGNNKNVIMCNNSGILDRHFVQCCWVHFTQVHKHNLAQKCTMQFRHLGVKFPVYRYSLISYRFSKLWKILHWKQNLKAMLICETI